MSSLRDKLRRLRPGAAQAEGVRPLPAPALGPELGPSDPLAELARRLTDAVAAGGGRGPLPGDGPVGRPLTLLDLGFEPSGGAWLRSRRFPWTHRIGTAPLEPAARADANMLGLLGLTPELADCAPDRALYLDTETTGLGGAGTVVFLVGVAYLAPEERCVHLEQWLIASPAHEHALLEAVGRRVESCAFIVSYNGKSFDVPLLRTRRVMNGLQPVVERPQLDLLHLVRRVHRHREWRKTLGNTEHHVLEFDRGPDVAGADVAERYHHFARTADASAIAPVVVHNEHDVLALVALVGLYGEPLSRLPPAELASIARTMHRAGDRAGAAEMATEAVRRGGGDTALRARAELAKARGDKGQALSDFERLSSEVDDPAVRLELAKLYEHHVRDPLRALGVALRGTGEDLSAHQRRTGRLERKIGATTTGRSKASALRFGGRCSHPARGCGRVSKMITVGCQGFPVPATRYFREFKFVEILETHLSMPGPGTIRRWRREAPAGFRFALLGPRNVGQEGFRVGKVTETALKNIDAVAQELSAQTAVFDAPPEFHPTRANRAVLKEFLAEVRKRFENVVFQPTAEWVLDDCDDMAEAVGAVIARDPLTQGVSKRNIAYYRLQGPAGRKSRYEDPAIERLAEIALNEAKHDTATYVFTNVDMFADAKRFKKAIKG